MKAKPKTSAQPETAPQVPLQMQLTDKFSVGARAFASFDLWMTGEVNKLTQRWQHRAAPCARKTTDWQR